MCVTNTSYRWKEERLSNQGMRPTHQLQVEEGGDIETIKCVRSPHTSYRWRGERDRAIKCMRSPHTSYRWKRRERQRANQVCALTHPPATGGDERGHRDNQVYALTTHQLRWREERDIEDQSSVCAHQPHQLTGWRGEERSHRANKVYALTTHQLQVEREVI